MTDFGATRERERRTQSDLIANFSSRCQQEKEGRKEGSLFPRNGSSSSPSSERGRQKEGEKSPDGP